MSPLGFKHCWFSSVWILEAISTRIYDFFVFVGDSLWGGFTKKLESWAFVGSLLRVESTKLQDLLAFVGSLLRVDSTKLQGLLDFVGRILKTDSTKQQELLLFVGAAAVFSSYERNLNWILSGRDTTKTLHRKIQSEGFWWATPLR